MAGRAITVFDPDGYVLVDGLLVRAVAVAGLIIPGDQVTLVRLAGREIRSADREGRPGGSAGRL
jgi:membrane-bound ClpP family serine protease